MVIRIVITIQPNDPYRKVMGRDRKGSSVYDMARVIHEERLREASRQRLLASLKGRNRAPRGSRSRSLTLGRYRITIDREARPLRQLA